jgi:cytoskeletal protein RodZ
LSSSLDVNAPRADVNHADFGRYLSRQRELRGLSRDEIARVTKIPPTLLAALEEGEVTRLPDRVFVLHWVRAYAEFIGLEPNETVLRYEEVEPLVTRQEPGRSSAAVRRGPKRLVLLGVGGLILVAVLLFWWALARH